MNKKDCLRGLYPGSGGIKLFLKMKLTILLFLLTSFQVMAFSGHTQQRVSLTMKNATIPEILKKIESTHSYRFVYDNEVKKSTAKVDLFAKSATIDYVMQQLLNNSSFSYQKINQGLVVVIGKPSENGVIGITGKVVDDKGAPVMGASVVEKGTTNGVSTTDDGSYTIEVVDSNAILVISAIGYLDKEVSVNGTEHETIVLTTAENTLEQVVVVGYGTQKKRDLTGSIASVNGDEIARMPNTNPVSSLQGKVAGLTISNSGTPGAAPVVRVRGVNSTNSSNPLYVVDGILQDNIDYLNPADIESIDVLRDASSIAIYGLRGANGVIAVTTKSAARGKTVINFQSSIGFNKVINKIAVTDAIGFKKLYDAQLANTVGSTPFDYTNFTANTNWQDQILRTALLTNQNLSLSNSGEKSSTYLNIGYNKQDGVVKYGGYERFIARLKQELRINEKIKVGGELSGTYWNLKPTDVTFNNALWAAPIVPVQASESMYYAMPSFQRAQVGNPVATINRGKDDQINRGYRFVGSLFAEWKIKKDLIWKSVVYTDLGFNSNRSYTALPYHFINIGEFGGRSDTTFDNRQFTSVSQRQEEFRRFQQDHTLTWNTNFGGGHRLTAMAGFTTVYNDETKLAASRRDTTLNVPNGSDYWYLDIININNPISNEGKGAKDAIVGSFGRVNYSFKNKYLLNATIRRDGSSKFAPNNRWGTFGSVGAGWVISDENFMINQERINFLKLRAAWGKVGNSNGVAANIYEPVMSNSSSAIFGNNVYTAVRQEYIPDPNLRWEIVRSIDLGLDIKAFNNRWNAEINIYDRTTSDILTGLEIPNDTRKYFTNLGKITNKGIEIATGWSDQFESGLRYSANANFSYNKNVVNSIGDKINFQIIGNEGANLTETGKSIGYFYGYNQIGIYQSVTQIENNPYYAGALPGDIMYADIDGNDSITTADRVYLGTPFPPYSFGLSFNIGYKGFDLLVEGQGVAGNKIYTQRKTARFATLNYEANRLNAWTEPGSSNVEPILDNNRPNNFIFSSYYLEKGDYFRLRTVQLGYSFQPTLLQKSFIKQARVYVSGQNIKTWTRVTGYSPEAPIGNILGGGADNGIYPVPATYTFGLNITF